MRTAIAGLIGRVLMLVVLISASCRSQAHDVWANGTTVPAWVKSACCGPEDVHIIDPSEVSGPDKKGYYHVKDVDQPIPGDRVYDSLDGVTYVFWNPNVVPSARYVYCLFVSRGF